jgi:hypothetical protein
MKDPNKPRRRAPYLEMYSEKNMKPEAWQDLLGLVNRIRPELVDSFYVFVNKKTDVLKPLLRPSKLKDGLR